VLSALKFIRGLSRDDSPLVRVLRSKMTQICCSCKIQKANRDFDCYTKEPRKLKSQCKDCYLRPETNLPVEGSHSSVVIKDLDYYDKYIDGYGLYDKIKNKMDQND